MDSLVLGSAVGEAVLGKKIGPKASLYGAVLGTLPDLDVLWVKDAVASFTEHRSFSHSVFILFLLAVVLSVLFKRCNHSKQGSNNISYSYWMFSVYLMLVTHPLLDWCTTYGTQLLWPFTNYPFALNNVFIIDPFYTIPLLIGLLWTVISRWRVPLKVALFYSCGYLLLSFVLQQSQISYFSNHYKQQGISPSKSLTQATPFNVLLWKNIAMVEGGYWVSYRSVFDSSDDAVQSLFFKSDESQLNLSQGSPELAKLKLFSKGFYRIKKIDDGVWFSDIRMGSFGGFVFNFEIAEIVDETVIFMPDSKISRASFRSKDMNMMEVLKPPKY